MLGYDLFGAPWSVQACRRHEVTVKLVPKPLGACAGGGVLHLFRRFTIQLHLGWE